MAGKSKIEWTDKTWNPIVGCSVLSAGCTNCYAMGMAARIERMTPDSVYAGLTRARDGKGPAWTGEVRMAPDKTLTAPLRWRAPQRIFVNSMGDLFHEDVPDAWIDRVFAVMALAPQHLFMVLTKRPERMRDYLRDPYAPARIAAAIVRLVAEPIAAAIGSKVIQRPVGNATPPDPSDLDWWPLPNVWLGASAEDQATANERIPPLLATLAAGRFLSAEPLLGSIELTRILLGESAATFYDMPEIKRARFVVNALRGAKSFDWPGLNLVIAGGESGPNARPMDPAWIRQIRDDCASAGVDFHFKQWGEWAPLHHAPGVSDADAFFINDSKTEARPIGDYVMGRIGKRAAGRQLDGCAHDALAPLPANA